MTGNPSWDPAVRARVQTAMDRMYVNIGRILAGYSDPDGLFDADSTSDMVGHGDITGICAVASKSVIGPVRAELDAAQAVIDAALAEADAWKREHYGPGYR